MGADRPLGGSLRYISLSWVFSRHSLDLPSLCAAMFCSLCSAGREK